jgi:hypothetical protein
MKSVGKKEFGQDPISARPSQSQFMNLLIRAMLLWKRVNIRWFLGFLFAAPLGATYGQCDIFKSEMGDVQAYEAGVNRQTDSLRVFAEAAAFAARFTEGRNYAQKAEALSGIILEKAMDAAQLAEEAQYQAELCGDDQTVSHAIAAQSLAIDARDFAEKAYANAKKARSARSLGDVRYYMRKSLSFTREARKSSQASSYAAQDALYSCPHGKEYASGGN